MSSEGRVLLIIGTVHFRNAQRGSGPAHYRNRSALDLHDVCEHAPAVPPLSTPTFRDNRLRSHPPHFASTASMPPPAPPQSIKMRRLAPTSPLGVRAISFLAIEMRPA
ncbi:MAG: hypothetical protein H0V70_06695 [Ktedonobacteraceae bacterium]|nr:hypothetical protein [Ktedonobacteraceae bacterium]